MSRTLKSAVVAAVLVAGIGWVTIAKSSPKPPEPVPVASVGVSPGETPGEFKVSAIIGNPLTKEVLARPNMVVKAGEASNSETPAPDGSVVILDVQVAPDGIGVRWVVRIQRGEEIIPLSEARVRLAKI